MKDLHRLSDYLAHISLAIERIHRYTRALDKVAFMQDELVQDAVVRNFEIIGEASNNIQKRYPEIEAQHPGLPLASAVGMRNALAHGYFKVDFDIVWETIQVDIPKLHIKIQEVIADLP